MTTAMTFRDLPLNRERGQVRLWVWRLPAGVVDSDGEELVRLRGTFLGMGTSIRYRHRDGHSGLIDGVYADRQPPGCPACRWMEVRLFSEADSDRFLAVRSGRTIVPGEETRLNFTWTMGAFELVDVLTVRARGGEGSDFLPVPASQSLAQAAALDPRVRDAYVNRATV